MAQAVGDTPFPWTLQAGLLSDRFLFHRPARLKLLRFARSGTLEPASVLNLFRNVPLG